MSWRVANDRGEQIAKPADGTPTRRFFFFGAGERSKPALARRPRCARTAYSSRAICVLSQGCIADQYSRSRTHPHRCRQRNRDLYQSRGRSRIESLRNGGLVSNSAAIVNLDDGSNIKVAQRIQIERLGRTTFRVSHTDGDFLAVKGAGTLQTDGGEGPQDSSWLAPTLVSKLAPLLRRFFPSGTSQVAPRPDV